MYDKYAEFYDICAAEGRGDLPVYLALAGEKAVIIDVGCGTGRLTAPLVAAGHKVVAVDLSPRMLEKCAAALATQPTENFSVLEHNLCAEPITTSADLAIVSWFAFNYVVASRDQESMLMNIASSLRPGGRIALDLFYPKCLKVGQSVWEERDVVIQDEPLLMRNDRRLMEGPVEVRTQDYVFGSERFRFVSRRRYVAPLEIKQLLIASDFTPEWISFDHGTTQRDFGSLDSIAGSYMVVARKD